MSYIFYLCMALCFIILQTTILVAFPVFDTFYDLMILMILYLGLFRPLVESLFAVFMFGFVMDSLSGAPFGLYLTIYMWVFFGVRWLIRYFHAGSVFLLPIVVFFGILLENVVFIFLAVIWKPDFRLLSNTCYTAVLQGIQAVCTGPLMIVAIRNLHTKWKKRFNELSSKLSDTGN